MCLGTGFILPHVLRWDFKSPELNYNIKKLQGHLKDKRIPPAKTLRGDRGDGLSNLYELLLHRSFDVSETLPMRPTKVG